MLVVLSIRLPSELPQIEAGTLTRPMANLAENFDPWYAVRAFA